METNDTSIGDTEEIFPDLMLTQNEAWDDINVTGMLTSYQWPNVNGTLLEQQYPENISSITGNIPSRDDFPGEFEFGISLDIATSGQHWVYSDLLKQLFIGMNKVLLMQFHVNPFIWSHSSTYFIRALPVYATDDYVNIPVNRCTFHSCEDDPQGRAHQEPGKCMCDHSLRYVGHVVRAECDANYLYDPRSERHSVRVLITQPQPGSEIISVPYSFACKTSCNKGMQRRPIHVIFTLENEAGVVFGRQKLGVKICSCPKRDKKRQEDDYNAEKSGERKRKRPITKEDVSNALLSTKQIKVEPAQEPVMKKEDIIQQIRLDLNQVDFYMKRIRANQEKLFNFLD